MYAKSKPTKFSSENTEKCTVGHTHILNPDVEKQCKGEKWQLACS